MVTVWCAIYFTKKYNLSTFSIFVTVLAAVDLFTSSVVIPLELLQFAWQYTYENVLVCKLNLFVKMSTTITSGFLFLCIAIDRYRKICRPFGAQISLRAARLMCITSAVLGVAFSWISPVIYSVQSAELRVYNLTISECAITRPMKQTLYPLISNVSLVFLFAGALTGIIMMYCFIAFRVKRQIKKKIGHSSDLDSRKQPADTVKMFNSSSDKENCMNNELELETSTVGNASNLNTSSDYQETDMDETGRESTERFRNSSKVKTTQGLYRRGNRRNRNRTTWIMFVISLAFIVSYLPLLCISLITFADKSFVRSLSDSERAVYKFVHRSYFLNCAVNPVIYGVWDTRFRKSCKILLACRKN